MFLDSYNSILTEDQDLGETTEKDASIDAAAAQQQTTTETKEETSANGMNDNLDFSDDGSMDDGTSSEDGTEGTTDDSSAVTNGTDTSNISDATKKLHLYKDYKDILDLYEKLINCFSLINFKELSDDTRKIFKYLNQKVNENYDKLNIIMLEKFSSLNYADLLKLYLYFKLNITSASEILKLVVNNEKEGNEKL